MVHVQDTSMPRLSVIGLGKLGSPMAAVFAEKGYSVVGLDLNAALVTALNAGRAPVEEPELQALIDRNRDRLKATQSYDEAVRSSDVSFIIVPTPSGPDRQFTNRFVVQAVEAIGHALRKKAGYHVVVVTSTVMPGSTGGEIREALERTSGRPVGQDLGLCYNPEFIALGSVVNDMLRPDMILIGECDSKAGDVLEAIYRRSTESNPEFRRMNFVNAELCKIAVNTYVTTKISYANMIADVCDHLDGADADVVTQALGADSRIGRKYLRGAIGYGGPCFPRDNKAFSALARSLGVRSDLAEATDAINDHQLDRLFGAVEALLPNGGRVAVLGMSYKPHTAVIEESQGVALAKRLAEAGYLVTIADPLAGQNAKAVLGSLVQLADGAETALQGAELAVVTTPWPVFRTMPRTALEAQRGSLVLIDPWRVIDPTTLPAHVRLINLGRGGWRWTSEGVIAGARRERA